MPFDSDFDDDLNDDLDTRADADEDSDEVGHATLFRDEADAQAADAAARFSPSEDQTVALQTLLTRIPKPGAYILTGAAGTGKTSIVQAILRRLTRRWSLLLIAPTWRAANRLTEVVGRRAYSLHSVIYGQPKVMRQCECREWSVDLVKPKLVPVREEVELDGQVETVMVDRARYTCPSCGKVYADTSKLDEAMRFEPKGRGDNREYRFVVVDEASMLSLEAKRDTEGALLDGKTVILYLGDANQLPPVDADSGEINFENADARLDRVHRQAAGNPVLALAHELKVSPPSQKLLDPSAYPFPYKVTGAADPRLKVLRDARIADVAGWAAKLRCAGEDVVNIAMSNQTRARINQETRRLSGAAAEAARQGLPIIPGDRLLARGNCKGSNIYNGELHAVLAVTRVTGHLLNERGRAKTRPRGGNTSEREALADIDATLGSLTHVGVFEVESYPIGAPEGTRRRFLLVLPEDRTESDLILRNPGDTGARNFARNAARAWREEYEAMLSLYAPEFQSRKAAAITRVAPRALLEQALLDGDVDKASAVLGLLHERGDWPTDEVRLTMARTALAEVGPVSEDDVPAVAAALCEPLYDAAKDEAARDSEDHEQYAQRVHGALNPHLVTLFDIGEALTGHAMQGSQAKHVGIVADRAFYGAWKRDRRAAMRWAYTALTRTSENGVVWQLAFGET